MSQETDISHEIELSDLQIQSLARVLLPCLQAYYTTDQGKAELAKWETKQDVKILKS